MALKKTIAKLNNYYDRLEKRKADRIKVAHVDKVIDKLNAKEIDLRKKIASAKKSGKKKRLNAKLKVVHGQITRAEWLRKQIKNAKKPGSVNDA